MRNASLIFRVIAPPVVCVLCLVYFVRDFTYYPLVFGLVIGLTNWGYFKYKQILGLVLCLILSYVTFFTGYFSLALTTVIFDFLGDLGNIIALIISAFIIAPLLVFFAFKFVFKFAKTRFTNLIVTISVFLLALQSYFMLNVGDSISDDLIDNKFFNPFTTWQIIMALAIQTIIYQNEL